MNTILTKATEAALIATNSKNPTGKQSAALESIALSLLYFANNDWQEREADREWQAHTRPVEKQPLRFGDIGGTEIES